jgi:hypothetical protein
LTSLAFGSLRASLAAVLSGFARLGSLRASLAFGSLRASLAVDRTRRWH